MESLAKLPIALGALSPLRRGILGLAVGSFVVEILLRYLAPRSRIYASWTHAIEAVGGVWTAVLLAIVYFAPVSVMSILSRLSGKDFLDRSLRPEPSFWRAHEPNPLGPSAATRHQF